jgi:hypothetical protein
VLRAILNFLAPTLHAQTYYDEGVEVIYESWDDGSDETWEGNLYARILSTDEWTTGIHQKDLSQEGYPIHFAERLDSQYQLPPFDCRRTGSECGYCNDGNVGDCALRTSISNWWWTCGSAAGSCMLPVPGQQWPLCVGTRCAFVLGMNVVYQTKEHFKTCYADWYHRAYCEG